MLDCAELRALRQAANRANKNASDLLAESERLIGVTGLNRDQVLDLILQALEQRKKCLAALVDHANHHDCAASGR